jgi:large subunit ribosomal protein L21
MFAIIRTGGKQYKVSQDTYLQVEKLDANVGDKIQISEVLMVSDGTSTTVGAPIVNGAVVTAEILEQGRAEEGHYFQKTPPSKLPP